MMTKIFYSYDRFSDSNRNFTTEHVKIVKTPGFPRFFSKFLKFQVFLGYFCLNCRIPGFSRFPGKVAILYMIKINKSKTLKAV